MTPEDLDSFREQLLQKRRLLLGDVEKLSEQALNREDGSHLPDHMADLGAETFNQEVALGILEGEEDEIREIDAAVERINQGTFGNCEECESEIPRVRIEAIPFARLCLDCKQKEEEELG